MAERGIATGTVVNAGKDRMGPDEALELARQHNKLVVAKGKKAVTFDLRGDDVDDEAIRKAIIGPSGWLRAPAWKRGKTLVVGFHAEAYDSVLG